MDLDQYIVEARGTLLDATQVIQGNYSRCAVVRDAGKVIGVLSEGDILRALLKGADIYSAIRPFVNHSFKFLPKRDVAHALVLCRNHGISLIPVVDENFVLIDVITAADVLNSVELSETARE